MKRLLLFLLSVLFCFRATAAEAYAVTEALREKRNKKIYNHMAAVITLSFILMLKVLAIDAAYFFKYKFRFSHPP